MSNKKYHLLVYVQDPPETWHTFDDDIEFSFELMRDLRAEFDNEARFKVRFEFDFPDFYMQVVEATSIPMSYYERQQEYDRNSRQAEWNWFKRRVALNEEARRVWLYNTRLDLVISAVELARVLEVSYEDCVEGLLRYMDKDLKYDNVRNDVRWVIQTHNGYDLALEGLRKERE